ncbi:MAG: MBL fold metallo-hydrolase [Bacteroidales bacterium]|nr:MBL fold metallo-hydrolase [Bacteroidales bacterium]
MKHTRLTLCLCASLLLGMPVRAASPYGWDAATNKALYETLQTYLRAMQTDLVGEPAYYMTQQLMVELETTFQKDPYAWMSQVHNFCNTLEAVYPPSLSHPSVIRGAEDRYDKIRRNLLRLRDYPMHQISLDNEPDIKPTTDQKEAFTRANRQWLQHKRAEFFDFLRSPRPSGDELQAVKLYSSGYVFRTREACIGIDICYAEGLYDGEGREELADLLDAVYVTHAHGDHYDIPLLKLMLQKGKAVVAPSTMARHLTAESGEKYLWEDSHLDPVPVHGVALTQAYMSAQGDEPCLLYLIQIGDWRLAHVGDNSSHANETLIYPLYPIADVVMGPVFQGVVNLLNNTKQAPNPGNVEQIYFNIHENEWHHTIDGRVSFQFLYTSTGALNSSSFAYPSCAIFDCGEHLTLYK